MSDLNVLIVGASVAGPTAAYWLAKAGANVTVIERFPQLRTSGQGIDIRTTGVTVMRRMAGMEEAVRAKLNPIEGFCFVHDDDKPIITTTATGDPEQQSLLSEYEIFRGDLGQILYDMTKDDERIRYVFGEQIASMQREDDGPITVTFANGLPTSKYDLVVACDGATSRTRAVGFECGVRDHMESSTSWAAYFSIEQRLLEGSMVGKAWSTIGGRWLAVGPDPSGRNRVTIMHHQPRNKQDATLPFCEAMSQGTDATKQYILKLFGGAGWWTDDILKGMMEADDFYASEVVQVKVPRLSNGRFVLVGDAGYATGFTGTGTSAALTGAYVLAGEIRRHKGDLAAGLKSYEERMKPIITDMQKVPLGLPGIIAPQTRWGIRLRNAIFTIVSWGMTFSGLFSWAGKLFGNVWASAFASDKYDLPDYDLMN